MGLEKVGQTVEYGESERDFRNEGTGGGGAEDHRGQYLSNTPLLDLVSLLRSRIISKR